MSSLHLVIHNKTYCSLKYLAFKVQVLTGYFIMEDRLWTCHNKTNLVLSNLSKLQTFTFLHCEEFPKSCTSNISEVLLQKLMETLISSSHSNLH
jgi:hypothetical protein